MIEIIEGRGVGAGKSYYVVTRVIKHLIAGGTVYYSDTLELIPEAIERLVRIRYGVILESGQMVAVPREEMARIHEVTPPGTDEMPVLIIMDEAQRYLNARDHADKGKRPLFEWCCESRHDSNDLIFISQNALNIDNQIRRLVTYVTRVRNMTGFKIAGVRWPFRQFLVHVFDGDGKTSMEKKFIPHDKGIFGCYKTKSMKGSHKRLLGEPIPKRQLQKVKGRKSMRFLIIMFAAVVVVGGAMVYKFLGRGIPGLGGPLDGITAGAPASSGRASSSVVAAAPAASRSGEPWTVRKEAFRGIVGDQILRTDEAQYQKGVMTPGGFCVGIDPVGRVALLRQSDGGLVYVVTVEESTPAPAGGSSALVSGSVAVPENPAIAKAGAFDYLDNGQRIALGRGDAGDLDYAQARIHGQRPEKR